MGIDADLLLTATSAAADVQRARILADKSASVFLRAYEAELGGASTAVARHQATSAALSKLETRLTLQVVTENSEAWNRSRDRSRVARWEDNLFKLWDAWLDKKTCPICRDLNGTLIPKRKQFKDRHTRLPIRPGAVHPYCRCEEQILTAAEARAHLHRLVA